MEMIVLELVIRGECAFVRGATQRCIGVENRVIAGSDQAMAAGHCLQDTHVAVEDEQLGALTHHQSAVGSACHLQKKASSKAYGELLRQVERHRLQPAPPWSFVGRLPPGQPLRAHGCRRPVLRLQRSKDVRHQVRREQYALDHLVRQRGVGGHALLGGSLQRRAVGAQPSGQLRQHVVRELAQPQAQPRWHGVRRSGVVGEYATAAPVLGAAPRAATRVKFGGGE